MLATGHGATATAPVLAVGPAGPSRAPGTAGSGWAAERPRGPRLLGASAAQREGDTVRDRLTGYESSRERAQLSLSLTKLEPERERQQGPWSAQ